MFSLVIPAAFLAMPAAYELDYSVLPAANTTAGYEYTIVFSYKGEPDVRVTTFVGRKGNPSEVASNFFESLADPSWRVKRNGDRITIYGYDDVRIQKLTVEGNGPKPRVRRVPAFPAPKK